MVARDDIETKLSAARTHLILDKPFLGVLALRLPMVAADSEWCPTSATDARCFYYNPGYIGTLDLAQTQFVLAHEVLHCALSHFARRQHRVKLRWDVACDYAINPLLIEDGLKPPPGTLIEPSYEGMTAEEIYPFIDENTDDEPMDGHVYDGRAATATLPPGEQDQRRIDTEEGLESRPQSSGPGGGAAQPPPLSTAEQEALKVQWQQRLAGAAQQAIHAGKLGGLLARVVDHLLQPQLPWRAC